MSTAKRRLDMESEYWRLVLSGVRTVEARRALGIGRKTGYRWRAETAGFRRHGLLRAPGRALLVAAGAERIATLRAQGLGVHAIADRLGRSPSTISREFRRNTLSHDRGVYDGDLAHARARQLARRPRQGRLLAGAQLRVEVQAELEPRADHRLLAQGVAGRPSWHVCHETIYQALYYGGKGGLSRSLTRRLLTGLTARKRRRRPDQRQPRRLVRRHP